MTKFMLKDRIMELQNITTLSLNSMLRSATALIEEPSDSTDVDAFTLDIQYQALVKMIDSKFEEIIAAIPSEEVVPF